MAKFRAFAPTISILSILMFSVSHAQQAAPAADTGGGLEEIVVTAQKRSESANSVPMSISALSGDDLRAQGINDVGDLEKVVPGFTYTPSPYAVPIYSIRGIGFNESSLGAKPDVSVYVDEVPLAFPIMTAGAGLDLQHVEVLKGPQGTLFGQNSTGGAINYVAAKPTNTFEAGVDVDYGRFNSVNLEGFVSGPLSDTLRGRIAIRSEQSGDWQQSYTTGNTTGRKNKFSERAILDWTPVEALKVEFSLSGYVDKSDNQAAQFLAFTPLGVDLAAVPGVAAYTQAPGNDRAADWGPRSEYPRDDLLIQPALRVEYALPYGLQLTSLTSYAHYNETNAEDPDGVTYQNLEYVTDAQIRSFNQEVRLAGLIGNEAHWIVGGNYARDTVDQKDNGFDGYDTNGYALGAPGFFTYYNLSDQTFADTAAFANIDYDVLPAVTLHAAARYTKADLAFNGCTGDSGDGALAAAWNRVFGTDANPGQCVTLSPTFTTGSVSKTLDQDNVSWRTGIDWKPADAALLYANVSKGYKSGSFPILSASVSGQLDPVTQESVLAYETGFKLTALDRTLQLNGALFYYDYTDKQIRGRVVVPVFGPLEALVNVPKSDIKGAELEVTAVPFTGLTAKLGATFIDSQIKNFTNYDPDGVQGNFTGESFPLTPRWQGFADAQYEWPVRDSLSAFVGGNLSARSGTNGGLGDLPLLNIPSYALLDLRAGVATSDGKWRFSLWGHNVTDKYYWTIADHIADTTVRFAGMPATFGVSATYRYK
jgi:outer membrane receptor protein involved in Fe transport